MTFKSGPRSILRLRVLALAFSIVWLGGGVSLGKDAGIPPISSTPSITASPTKFGAGQIVTVTGTGFDPSITVNIWFDFDGDGAQDPQETSTTALTDAAGAFSGATITVIAGPNEYNIRAEGPAGTVASTPISVGSCWIQDEGCSINDASVICIIGDSPSDLISDCKAIDSNYSDTTLYPNGYDFKNVGPRFLGAGVLAAAAVSVNPIPFSGCVAMQTAIVVASSPPYGNTVPDLFYAVAPTHGLLSTACGVPPLGIPPFDLVLYGGAAALEAALPGNHGLPDPALDDAAIVAGVVGAVEAISLAADANLPGSGEIIRVNAQQVLAAAAVAGAVACGFVNYYCNGSDITAELMFNTPLQTQLKPYLFDGKRWGDLIGWAQVSCKSNTPGSCTTPSTLPVPGSAGVNNIAAPIMCATGTVVGLSIGYDGDIGFDVNDSEVDPKLGPGPGIAPFTNYHNFEPGPGGSESPAGIDIEVPLADRGIFMPTLANLRIGKKVKVCGRWVADMHQFWNELHPMTSLVILDATPPVITPTITGTLGANGWYTGDVHVTWGVEDSESAVTDSTGCDPTTLNSDTTSAGTTLTCSATSEGGTTTQSVTAKRDATPPTIGAAATTAPNGSAWYHGDVTVHFTCADGASGIPALACPADQILGTEGAAVASTAQTISDAAGNTSAPSNVVTVRIDKTRPTISAAATTLPNAAGWYRGPVTVHFTCADGLSGIPSLACPADQVLATEGVAVSSTAQTVTDAADNVSDPSNVVTVRIDRTAPSVSVTGVTNGAQYVSGAVPVAGCQTIDALSGPATAATLTVTTTGTNGVGSFTATCAGAIDVAGNPQPGAVSATYLVVYGFGGFLSPLPTSKLSKSGSSIPVKFRLAGSQGQPINSSLAAALAASGNVKATLTGPGIAGVESLCAWDAGTLFFQCNIKTPTSALMGPAYAIGAYENLGAGFVLVPGVGSTINPETVFFK